MRKLLRLYLGATMDKETHDEINMALIIFFSMLYGCLIGAVLVGAAGGFK